MENVTIFSENNGKIEVIETNVPLAEIKKFLDDFCEKNGKKNETENENGEKKYFNEAEKIMATKYPDFYEKGKDVYDDDTFGGIELLAKDLGYTVEKMVDSIYMMATTDIEGAMLSAAAVAVATNKYRESKREE